MVAMHRKAEITQSIRDPGQENLVEEHAAGEYDAVKPRRFPDGLALLRRHRCQRVVKTHRQFFRRYARLLIADQLADHASPVKPAYAVVVIKCDGIHAVFFRRTLGQRLQQRRSLPLIGYRCTACNQRIDAVKQSAHARRGRTVYATGKHGRCQLVAAFQPGVPQKGCGDAPDLPDGRIAAGQQDRPDGSHTHSGLIAASKELSAPDGIVRSKAGAIPDHADTIARKAVIRHTGGHVRVMVLYRKHGQALRFSPPCGQVIRMQIADQLLGRDPKEIAEPGNLRLVMGQRLGVFEVADVLAVKGVLPLAHGEARLLLRTQRKNAVHVKPHRDGLRRIASAPADKVFFPVKNTDEAVIAARFNVPVVQKVPVRNAGQAA